MDGDRQGCFAWYELVTSDRAGAQRFYRDVLGWHSRDSGHSGMAYRRFQLDGVDVAGLVEPPAALRDSVQPFWKGYVAVDDVDACAALARSLGAAIHQEPTDIAALGRFAMIVDPQGAVIVPFRPLQPAVPALSGRAGRVGWHELMANDREAAFAFYARLFGWAKGEAVDIGPAGPYQIVTVDGVPVGGMMASPAGVPTGWRYYLQVDAVGAAAGRVAAAGGAVVHGPMPVPGGQYVAMARDPQGALVGLVGSVL